MHGLEAPQQDLRISDATPTMFRPGGTAPWVSNPDRLTELADAWAGVYQGASPFPHVVLDDLLPDALIDELVEDFPSVDDPGWLVHEEEIQRKRQWADANRLPPVAASVVALFQAAPFLTFLERLTGIDGLIGDPHCRHGGLHQTMAGGYLKIHTDSITQPELRLQRRVNVIVFLNRDWLPEWGGDLELWDAEMTTCVKRIEPRFNRVVVFDAVRSNHGHPAPATSPPDIARRSLALYYYISPAHPLAIPETAVNPATWLPRPGEAFELPHAPLPALPPRHTFLLRRAAARVVRRFRRSGLAPTKGATDHRTQ